MVLNNHSGLGVLVGALLLLPVSSYAGSTMGQITFQIGMGKVSFDKNLNTTALTMKGYNVNSYSQSVVDEGSYSLGMSMSITPKISAELSVQKMGEVKSSLDVTLPAGTSAEQAAQDIVAASPQQLGGLTIAVGANYKHPVTNRVNLRLGAGMSLGKDDHRLTINGEEFDYDDSSMAPYLKLGIGVKLTPSFAITANTERYFFDDQVDRHVIGLSYTF